MYYSCRCCAFKLLAFLLLVSAIDYSASVDNRFTDASQADLLASLTDSDRYNKHLIPHFETEDPINVTVNIKVTSLGGLDAGNMEFSVGMYLRLVWLDDRLAFSRLLENDPKFDNLKSLQDIDVHPNFLSSIWQPDPAFTNFKGGNVQMLLTPSKMLRIFRNGTVLFSTMLTVELSCNMDLRLYPMDMQICTIEFESFGYRTKNIRFVWDHYTKPVDIDDKATNMAQFKLLEQYVCTTTCHRQLTTGNFTCLRVSLFFKRSYGFHLLQTYLPSVLIVMLSWVSFYITPDAIPGRVTVGVTSVLTMTTQSSGSRKDLPPVSYIKAIDVWMTTCLTFVFAALLEFAYVNMLREREKKRLRREELMVGAAGGYGDHPDKYQRRDDYNTSRGLRGHNDHRHTGYSGDNDDGMEMEERGGGSAPERKTPPTTAPVTPSYRQQWREFVTAKLVDKVAKLLFPLAFGLFNLAYWLYYLTETTVDVNCVDE